jgi:hypothetical protein
MSSQSDSRLYDSLLGESESEPSSSRQSSLSSTTNLITPNQSSHDRSILSHFGNIIKLIWQKCIQGLRTMLFGRSVEQL